MEHSQLNLTFSLYVDLSIKYIMSLLTMMKSANFLEYLEQFKSLFFIFLIFFSMASILYYIYKRHYCIAIYLYI